MFRVILTLKQAIRKRQLIRHTSSNFSGRISFLLILLLGLILFNTLGMLYFEEMRFGDALWLSFTTVTTVGYGDFSPSTLGGRVVTILSMYTFSISLLSMIAAEVIEGRIITTEKKRKGLWEWKGMENHIQIINTPNEDTERYLDRLITQIKSTPALESMQVQLLSRKFPEGLPATLSKHKVLHRTGSAEEGNVLETLNLEHAKHIIILARDANSSLSDSLTFDILSRVTELNANANIVVEAVVDENRKRFLNSGASAVLRPIRAYPEMIVRSVANPGTEQVLEDLFQIKGDSLHRLECRFSGKIWKDILLAFIDAEIGTVLGYIKNGEIILNPKSSALCEGDAFVILAKGNPDVSPEKITALIS